MFLNIGYSSRLSHSFSDRSRVLIFRVSGKIIYFKIIPSYTERFVTSTVTDTNYF